MLLKTVLSKTLRRKQDSPAPPSDAHSSPPPSPGSPSLAPIPAADDRDNSYAEANTLTKLLMQQSRRCTTAFFKQEAPRRPKMRKMHSEGDVVQQQGIEAPTTTPTGLFLSRCQSLATTSTTTDGKSDSCGQRKTHRCSLSLAETCSTTAEAETGKLQGNDVSLGKEDTTLNQGGESTSTSTTGQQEQEPRSPGAVKDVLRNAPFSFISNVETAKRWSRNVIHEFKIPAMTKRKKRKGKEPAPEEEDPDVVPRRSKSKPRVPKQELQEVFQSPSTSDCLKGLELEGGHVAPKQFSAKTVKMLDILDREERLANKELARIAREREQLLQRAETEDVDEAAGDGEEEIGAGGMKGRKGKGKKKMAWKSVKKSFRGRSTGKTCSSQLQPVTVM